MKNIIQTTTPKIELVNGRWTVNNLSFNYLDADGKKLLTAYILEHRNYGRIHQC